ncbi:MAG: hypothetical protein WCA35_24950, partial [Kovacikia sp.]
AGLKQIRRVQPHLTSYAEAGTDIKSPSSTQPKGFFCSTQILFQALFGSLYMFHWLPIVSSMTARISVRPKRLKWVKTVHQGTHQEPN